MKKKPIRSSNKHIDRNTINIKKRSIFFTNFPYSIYISILSIIISSIAAFYTYKSYDINYKQYKDDQLIVLNGKFENDTTLYVSSIDEKKFIKGKLFFPPLGDKLGQRAVRIGRWPIAQLVQTDIDRRAKK